MRLSEVANRILSISALVSATAAVAIAVYEARITREHQELSVWPYLDQYNSSAGGQYQRIVNNVGLGPALVKSFQIGVDGKVMRSWAQVIQALTGVQGEVDYVYTSLQRGTVLLPDRPVKLLVMPYDSVARVFHDRVGQASLRICYCSLYGACWVSDSREPEPRPVDACEAAPAAEFQE